MNRHATLVHHRAWRLILTVATGNEDARRTLASDVGEDADTWYQIANIAALQVAQLLDAEYMAAECEAAFYGDCDWVRLRLDLWHANREMASSRPSLRAWAVVQHGLSKMLLSPAVKRRAGIELTRGRCG